MKPFTGALVLLVAGCASAPTAPPEPIDADWAECSRIGHAPHSFAEKQCAYFLAKQRGGGVRSFDARNQASAPGPGVDWGKALEAIGVGLMMGAAAMAGATPAPPPRPVMCTSWLHGQWVSTTCQ